MQTKHKPEDALELLLEDHKEVKALFKVYQKLVDQNAPENDKGSLAEKICAALSAHAEIEEEIFYPAVRDATHEDDLLDEAEVEHATAKELIHQLESMQPNEVLYDAKVKVLGEYIDHHVKEEEGEMFPKAKKPKLDLAALGMQMAERKAELKADPLSKFGRDKPPSKRTDSKTMQPSK